MNTLESKLRGEKVIPIITDFSLLKRRKSVMTIFKTSDFKKLNFWI